MRQNETDSSLDEYERHLRVQIAAIQRQYEKAIEPLVRELGRIYAMRPSRIQLTPEQAEQLGLVVRK